MDEYPLGPMSAGTEGTSAVLGASLPLFQMENLKAKAQCLVGGGAEAQGRAAQITCSDFEFSAFSPTLSGARGQWKWILSSNLEGKQESATQLASYDLSRKEKISSLFS